MRKQIDLNVIFGLIIIIIAIVFIVITIYATIYNYNEQRLITSGYIIDKKFNEAYTTTHYNNETKTSSSSFHPAKYNIYIQSNDGNHKAWYEVTEYIYNQYKIGDYIKNVNKELK